jgi:hypothetical protein
MTPAVVRSETIPRTASPVSATPALARAKTGTTTYATHGDSARSSRSSGWC